MKDVYLVWDKKDKFSRITDIVKEHMAEKDIKNLEFAAEQFKEACNADRVIFTKKNDYNDLIMQLGIVIKDMPVH